MEKIRRPKAMAFVFSESSSDKIHCPYCGSEMEKAGEVAAVLEQIDYACPSCKTRVEYLSN